MPPAPPRVSVLMASYNHELFVGQALESVLRQSFSDFEFLIADDGSSDATPDVVSGFSDPRIRFDAWGTNRSAGVVKNELVHRACGEYIAHMNSDDFWPTDKLEYQVNFLDAHPKNVAIFGRVRFVDKESRTIPKRELPFGQVFDVENRSSPMWLRRFFDQGNCLCHPTVLIRRRCYDVLGDYDTRLRQLPDFDMWIRLVKRYSIFVSDRELISFRIRPGENVSSPTPENSARAVNELYLIGPRFFDDVSADFLREGFSDCLIKNEVPSECHADVEKTLLYFRGTHLHRDIYHSVGLQLLHGLLGSPRHREVLTREYDIDDRYFHKLMVGNLPPPIDTAAPASIHPIVQRFGGAWWWPLTAPARWIRRKLLMKR